MEPRPMIILLDLSCCFHSAFMSISSAKQLWRVLHERECTLIVELADICRITFPLWLINFHEYLTHKRVKQANSGAYLFHSLFSWWWSEPNVHSFVHFSGSKKRYLSKTKRYTSKTCVFTHRELYLLVGEPFFELCVFILEDGGCSLTKNFTPGFGAIRLIPPLKLCFRAFGLRRHLAACVGGPRMWVDGIHPWKWAAPFNSRASMWNSGPSRGISRITKW